MSFIFLRTNAIFNSIFSQFYGEKNLKKIQLILEYPF
jgi:hypothetical protein